MAEEVNPISAPLVSVIMSLYNSERYLKDAIDSVLTQTLTDFEFIIIDDGSKDGSAEIVRSYNDSRIRLISQENAGLPAALNRGIRASGSDFLARMDPDDICLPERLEKQYEFLLHHEEVAVVGTAATCIDELGEKLADIRMVPRCEVGEVTLPESPCVHPSVMFRRSAFERAGGYPEGMRYGGEDAVLFNRILSFGVITNISDSLMLYRLSPSSMSQKSSEFNYLLRQIVRKEALAIAVTDGERQRLAEEYKRSGSGWFSYHMYVGKLFLRRDGNEVRARSHLIKALKISPLSLFAWICLVGSYIPSAWRISLQSFLKKSKKRHG